MFRKTRNPSLLLIPLVFGLMGIASGSVAAQTTPTLEAVPEPPELPPQVKSGEVLEPDVTITRRSTKTVTEYRVNGKLRAVKIEPKSAPAYYLVDTDADGRLDQRTDRFDPNFAIPQWVIFSW